MSCQTIGNKTVCNPTNESFTDRARNTIISGASDIAAGVGDTLWGIVQFPTDALKYITKVDSHLGEGRPWDFRKVGRSLFERIFPPNLTGFLT
jgi:hypothetical protein